MAIRLDVRRTQSDFTTCGFVCCATAQHRVRATLSESSWSWNKEQAFAIAMGHERALHVNACAGHGPGITLNIPHEVADECASLPSRKCVCSVGGNMWFHSSPVLTAPSYKIKMASRRAFVVFLKADSPWQHAGLFITICATRFRVRRFNFFLWNSHSC